MITIADVDTKTVKKPAYGETVVPGSDIGPAPAKPPYSMLRDDLGRTRGPSEYQAQDQFGFGSDEVTERPLPMNTQAQNPNAPAPAEKRKVPMPQQRTE